MASTVSASFFSGKGGVGKTTIALNTACALNGLSMSTLLLDCDLGLANVDAFLGQAPEHTLQDLMTSDLEPEDVLCSIIDPGTDFIPSATGMKELVELDQDMRATLLSELSPLLSSYDSLFLDLGAGITPTVLSFAAMCRLPVVVVTPEPTSLTDGYAMIKVLSATFGMDSFLVAVNMAMDLSGGEQAFERLQATCREFLSISPELLGVVRYDEAAGQALSRQRPLVLSAPESRAAMDIALLARELAGRIRELGQDEGHPPLLDIHFSPEADH